ncbi:hypothetical protein L7F22_012569 [Adiantum nelumboides]|nr:hypothetical protein [Adiantum nelumboides]
MTNHESNIQIVSEKLTENNFHAWKFRITNYLKGKGYRDYVEGANEAPPVIPDIGAFAEQVVQDVEPTCFEEAAENDKWQEAMNEEMDALYKARLVAKGYAQIYGIDYEETFAPVAKMATVRAVIAVAVAKGWILHQMDVKNAFLHGDLQEEVYMEQPLGYHDTGHPDYVCKLQKALYGLKQAPRAWHDKVAQYLITIGFHMADADHSLYVQKIDFGIVIITIYVDDLIIGGNALEDVEHVKALLCKQFDMKDLGELHYFLGIEMIRNEGGVWLSQKKYGLDMLMK